MTFKVCAPSNTPVTPPSLDYLEKAFSKMSSSFGPLNNAAPAILNQNNNTNNGFFQQQSTLNNFEAN